MTEFEPTSDNDKRAIVHMIDTALAQAHAVPLAQRCARIALVFEHAGNENPLPYFCDYIESVRCTVENIVTVPAKGGNIMREILVRVNTLLPWDGSID